MSVICPKCGYDLTDLLLPRPLGRGLVNPNGSNGSQPHAAPAGAVPEPSDAASTPSHRTNPRTWHSLQYPPAAEQAAPVATTIIDVTPELDRSRELAEVRLRLLALEYDQKFLGPVLGILVHNASRAARRQVIAKLDEIEAAL